MFALYGAGCLLGDAGRLLRRAVLLGGSFCGKPVEPRIEVRVADDAFSVCVACNEVAVCYLLLECADGVPGLLGCLFKGVGDLLAHAAALAATVSGRSSDGLTLIASAILRNSTTVRLR